MTPALRQCEPTYGLGMKPAGLKHPLARHTRVITVLGEQDFDSEGEDRITPPGSVGRITGIGKERDNGDPGFCYDLEFENGMWLTKDDNELDNPAHYRIVL